MLCYGLIADIWHIRILTLCVSPIMGNSQHISWHRVTFNKINLQKSTKMGENLAINGASPPMLCLFVSLQLFGSSTNIMPLHYVDIVENASLDWPHVLSSVTWCLVSIRADYDIIFIYILSMSILTIYLGVYWLLHEHDNFFTSFVARFLMRF